MYLIELETSLTEKQKAYIRNYLNKNFNVEDFTYYELYNNNNEKLNQSLIKIDKDFDEETTLKIKKFFDGEKYVW